MLNLFHKKPKSNGRPDFICVGMQKAGTRWLYDQLDSHSHFVLPALKELHYFNGTLFGTRRDKDLQTLNRCMLALIKNNNSMEKAKTEFFRTLYLSKPARHCYMETTQKHFAMINQTDLIDPNMPSESKSRLKQISREHYEELAPPELFERYCEVYRQSFKNMMSASKGDKYFFTGEITPAYSTLSESEIARIVKFFPSTHFLLLVRNPVDRFISAMNMSWRRSDDEPLSLGSDIETIDAYLARRGYQDRSYPSEIYKRFEKHVSPARLHTFFFDDLVTRPEWLRKEIVEKVTGTKSLGSFKTKAGFNRKSNHAKLNFNDEATAYVREKFEHELAQCRRIFGSHADFW